MSNPCTPVPLPPSSLSSILPPGIWNQCLAEAVSRGVLHGVLLLAESVAQAQSCLAAGPRGRLCSPRCAGQRLVTQRGAAFERSPPASTVPSLGM